MKKFKKSIEISTENISDVLQVPIVTSVYKTKFFKNPFIEGRSNPCHTSAVREILDPYIGEDGFIKECGLRKVHTEEHGDFCIILYHNPSEVMALRAFYLNSKKK